MSRLPYFLMPSVSGCWYWSWMPCSVSSAKIVLLLASTSTGERAELAAEMAPIMSVKPGPSVPEVAATSPVARQKASAAWHIDPSWRPE